MAESAPRPETPAGLLGALARHVFYVYAALIVAGVAISEHLIDIHIGTKYAGAGDSGVCSGEGFSCADAASSAYAEIAGLPIAVLGLGFYLAAFVLLFVWRFAAQLRAPLASIFLLGGLLSVLYSLFLAMVSALDIGKLCPFCMGLYAVNTGLLLTAALTHPSGWRAAVLGLPAALSRREVASTAVVLVAATAAAHGLYTHRVDDAARNEPPPKVEPAVYVAVGDAPGRGAVEPALTVVEFSDFQCPYCKQLAEALSAAAEALPVRYHFKHYPLDAKCNRALRETVHENACLAATAMVCARRLGGDDRGWAMHDLLFEHASRLDRASILDLADDIGFDTRRFGECLGDRIALAAVKRDIEQGIALGVEGTPTWFVNGHRVTSALRSEVVQAILERFLRVRLGRSRGPSGAR